MTTAEIIQYLRLNVHIQTEGDSAYLSMTDEEILLYLNMALTRDFPEYSSVEEIPPENIYPLMLLAKKELFMALAVKDAVWVDMTADNNNSLKKSQRFDHYMALVKQADEEYEQYAEGLGAGERNTLTAYDVLLPNRYNTPRNYAKTMVPKVRVFVDTVADTFIELSWSVRMSQFKCYKVYISDNQIWDSYSLTEKVSEDAQLVATILDIHQRGLRITNLNPDSVYHVLVMAVDKTTSKGCIEIIITTEKEIKE